MPKTRISKDERYPDYGLTESSGLEIEVDAAFLRRYEKVLADYDSLQEQLETLYQTARKKNRLTALQNRS
jgi:hypothetical protein